MVSYGVGVYHSPLTMYQKNHASNLSYPPTHSWYPPSYPPTHHPSNQQYLGASNAGADSDSTHSPMFYNGHHHMFHQTSPDWTGHENYAVPSQSSASLLQSAMTPSAAALHLPQSLGGIGNANHHNSSEHLNDGLPNIPPSPPATVNSACSEMSSPGVTNGGGNGQTSPIIGSLSGNRPSQAQSPYDWMKKPSYQSQPHPGKNHVVYSHSIDWPIHSADSALRLRYNCSSSASIASQTQANATFLSVTRNYLNIRMTENETVNNWFVALSATVIPYFTLEMPPESPASSMKITTRQSSHNLQFLNKFINHSVQDRRRFDLCVSDKGIPDLFDDVSMPLATFFGALFSLGGPSFIFGTDATPFRSLIDDNHFEFFSANHPPEVIGFLELSKFPSNSNHVNYSSIGNVSLSAGCHSNLQNRYSITIVLSWPIISMSTIRMSHFDGSVDKRIQSAIISYVHCCWLIFSRFRGNDDF